MDKSKIIAYGIMLAIIIAFGFWLWNWHNESLDSATRQQIARTDGIIEQLNRELVKSHIEGIRLKKIADSAIVGASKVDTIYIKAKYDKNFSNIRHLGTNALVSDLAKRLPH